MENLFVDEEKNLLSCPDQARFRLHLPILACFLLVCPNGYIHWFRFVNFILFDPAGIKDWRSWLHLQMP
jgi:hypothetical protein